jgi:hypothetical protein
MSKGKNASSNKGDIAPRKRNLGAGRKPDEYRRRLDAYLTASVPRDEAVDPGWQGGDLLDFATHTIVTAMRDRDEDGNVTAAGVRAATHVWDRAFGRCVEKKEVYRTSISIVGRLSEMVLPESKPPVDMIEVDVRPLTPTPALPEKPMGVSTNGHHRPKGSHGKP